ncbi:MAG: hypothetical protein OEM29_00475 [Thermoplasmata archaeon]|nr:hypothetical protein [Thermoplasmata archaeon]
MLKRDINRAVEQSTRRLFKVAVPPVKFWLLTYVMGKGIEDHEVQKALEETKKYGPRVKLLDKLREDGTWPISSQRKAEENAGPGPPYGWTYITMLRNLFWLIEYCADPDEGYIEESLDKILSWQDDEGFIKGPMDDMIPRPHYNGFALAVLRGFGRKRTEPGISRIADWLFRSQRADGGWNIPYLQDMRYLPEYKSMKLGKFKEMVSQGKTVEYAAEDYDHIPSCYWTTVGVLRGLGWIPSHERINDSRRGGSFVLNGFFKRNYHPGFYKSEINWRVLKFPTYYGSGLTALDSLVYLGFGPEEHRMEMPIRWLLSARAKDGFWYQTERPHALNDQWLTVVTLCVLSFYSRDRGQWAMSETEGPLYQLRVQ